MTFLAQALVACCVSMLLIIWLRRPALRFGLVDHPGGRKQHGSPVPLTGGVALTAGFFFAVAVSFTTLGDYRVLFVSMVLLAVIGILDDVGEVPARTKLGMQIIAAVLMTSWGNLYLLSLGDLFSTGPVQLRNWGIPLTVFATVAIINGVNMFDGVDGLAGSLIAVMIAFFAGFAWALGDINVLKLLVVLLGAIAGFLFFNLPHRFRGRWRTFMGDAGSLVLGFVVAWFSVELTQRAGPAVPPVVMLWVVGLVLFDVCTVTVRRLVRRRDVASPDRAHIHHLLLRCGFSDAKTVATLVTINTTLAALGVAGWLTGMPESVLFFGFIALSLAYLSIFLRPAYFLRRSRAS